MPTANQNITIMLLDLFPAVPSKFHQIQYKYIYTLRAHHQECIFHRRMRPQEQDLVAAPFEHKPTDS